MGTDLTKMGNIACEFRNSTCNRSTWPNKTGMLTNASETFLQNRDACLQNLCSCRKNVQNTRTGKTEKTVKRVATRVNERKKTRSLTELDELKGADMAVEHDAQQVADKVTKRREARRKRADRALDESM